MWQITNCAQLFFNRYIQQAFYIVHLTHYLPVSSYDDRGSKFKFYIKKGSMKKFPMSVATMRR